MELREKEIETDSYRWVGAERDDLVTLMIIHVNLYFVDFFAKLASICRDREIEREK